MKRRRAPDAGGPGQGGTILAPDAARPPAITVRTAAAAHDGQIAAIWNREIACAVTTTDTQPRDPAAQRRWREAHGDGHPVLVAVAGDEVLAFGALTAYRAKPAFAHTVENSIYVRQDCRDRGLGALVLGALLGRARAAGHRSVLARITSENAASIALHARAGFRLVGVEREVAFKLDRWLDVTVMQRMLADG
ncbi:MAG: N-acetyltransferase [Candidatus Rokubacteria bacterium]|nr:N-acetyltransferase [Candidatus Rokubacteria bacterium]